MTDKIEVPDIQLSLATFLDFHVYEDNADALDKLRLLMKDHLRLATALAAVNVKLLGASARRCDGGVNIKVDIKGDARSFLRWFETTFAGISISGGGHITYRSDMAFYTNTDTGTIGLCFDRPETKYLGLDFFGPVDGPYTASTEGLEFDERHGWVYIDQDDQYKEQNESAAATLHRRFHAVVMQEAAS
ncbi:MAG TPA: hypothetical protein VHY35_10555 [Stellaceae bacterium]|jgi:hypothetical protein|nr:hypothetical protein [Stellaceae bacterium]